MTSKYGNSDFDANIQCLNFLFLKMFHCEALVRCRKKHYQKVWSAFWSFLRSLQLLNGCFWSRKYFKKYLKITTKRFISSKISCFREEKQIAENYDNWIGFDASKSYAIQKETQMIFSHIRIPFCYPSNVTPYSIKRMKRLCVSCLCLPSTDDSFNPHRIPNQKRGNSFIWGK